MYAARVHHNAQAVTNQRHANCFTRIVFLQCKRPWRQLRIRPKRELTYNTVPKLQWRPHIDGQTRRRLSADAAKEWRELAFGKQVNQRREH